MYNSKPWKTILVPGSLFKPTIQVFFFRKWHDVHCHLNSCFSAFYDNVLHYHIRVPLVINVQSKRQCSMMCGSIRNLWILQTYAITEPLRRRTIYKCSDFD